MSDFPGAHEYPASRALREKVPCACVAWKLPSCLVSCGLWTLQRPLRQSRFLGMLFHFTDWGEVGAGLVKVTQLESGQLDFNPSP